MNVTAVLSADAPPDAVFDVVADLGRYPSWLDIVSRAEPAVPMSSDRGPAWSVDLRAQLGPLRRSKRLRMVRTSAERPNLVRFERGEADGRTHSDWVLEAIIDRTDEVGTIGLQMSLHYGGNMWVPMLDRLLREEIERSRPRLLGVLAEHS